MEVDEGSATKIRPLAPLDGCASRLKNEFTEDEKCHNLMSWLKYNIEYLTRVVISSVHVKFMKLAFCTRKMLCNVWLYNFYDMTLSSEQ